MLWDEPVTLRWYRLLAERELNCRVYDCTNLVQAGDFDMAGLDIQSRDSANLSLISSVSDDNPVTLFEWADVVFVFIPATVHALQNIRVDGGVVPDILASIISRGKLASFVDFPSSLTLALDVHR